MGRQAIAVVRVSRAGSAKHISYICRPEAVRSALPRERQMERVHEREASVPELGVREHEAIPSSRAVHANKEKESALEQLSEERGTEQLTHKADAVWTWNAPSYVTGDDYGIHKQSEGLQKSSMARPQNLVPESVNRSLNGRPLSLEEKIEDARAHFGLLSDSEKRKGGINSYRAMLTVKGDASDHEMRGAINDFLRQNFPQAQALAALHRNTSHVHAHLYIHARQLDGKKINLGQDYFRLDESWAKICSEHFKDRTIYDDHMRLKSETQRWKQQRAQAQTRGQSIPAKSGRWADGYEVKHGVSRAWDNHWVGRLKAVARVAETKAEYFRVANASSQEVIEAVREAQELQQKLQSVATKRLNARSEAKREWPAEVVTIEEQRELTRYARAIHDATATRRISVHNQPLPLQAAFDFTNQTAEQIRFDFDTIGAEKISRNQTGIKDRKPKLKSDRTLQIPETRPAQKVIEKLVEGQETSYAIQTQQFQAREQEFRSAHAAAVHGLRLMGEKEGVVPNVQEFARAESAHLRQEIQATYGFSIQELGYTRENWATNILNRANEALRREAANYFNSAAAQTERDVSSMRRAIEEGEERMLSMLAGEGPRSHLSGLPDHAHTFNRLGQDRSPLRQHEAGANSISDAQHDQSAKEEVFEQTDRIEHFFFR